MDMTRLRRFNFSRGRHTGWPARWSTEWPPLRCGFLKVKFQVSHLSFYVSSALNIISAGAWRSIVLNVWTNCGQVQVSYGFSAQPTQTGLASRYKSQFKNIWAVCMDHVIAVQLGLRVWCKLKVDWVVHCVMMTCCLRFLSWRLTKICYVNRVTLALFLACQSYIYVRQKLTNSQLNQHGTKQKKSNEESKTEKQDAQSKGSVKSVESIKSGELRE